MFGTLWGILLCWWSFARAVAAGFSNGHQEGPREFLCAHFPYFLYLHGFEDWNRSLLQVNILLISFANWCILESKTQSYLPSYTAVSQHSFAPLPESSSGGPTAYTLSGFSSPSKYFGTYKTTYKRPKIYTVLSQKYTIPTVGYEVANLKHFQEEYSHHAPAQYEFQYKVHDPYYGSEFGHAETRHGDVAKGQYVVLLPDGRRQIVDYIADSYGYRPTIRYERSFDKIAYGR